MRLMESPLIRYLLLACSLLLLAAPGRTQERSTDELLQEVLAAPEKASPDLFEAIAKPGDAEAMAALKQCLKAVMSPRSTEDIVWAFRHFDQDKVRRVDALMTLEDLAWNRCLAHLDVDEVRRERRSNSWAGEGYRLVSRAAARTLRTFGEHANSILEEILREHHDPVVRQIAIGGLVGELARRGTRDELELILEHYRPDVSGTFQTGVLCLRTFSIEVAQKRLMRAVDDQRLDDDVRAMALTALVDDKGKKIDRLLVKQLRGKVPLLQQKAAKMLSARGVTGHEKELARVVRGRTLNGRAARYEALLALAAALNAQRKTDELRDLLFEAVENDRFELRLGAVAALPLLNEVAAREHLVGRIRDINPEVRLGAIDSVLELRLKEAIPNLIERVERDSARIRRRAHDALELLTGIDHGEGTRWRKWWDAEGEHFVPPSLAEAEAARAKRAKNRAESPTRATFCGIPIENDRLIFLVDRSGSMGLTYRGGGTCWEWARAEIGRLLADLPGRVKVNLVWFEEMARSWRRELTTLDDKTRADLTRFLDSYRLMGLETNLHAGLMMALRDPNVETIVFLTDGYPTTGAIVSQRGILAALRVELELRHVVVHTVSVAGYSEFLEKIAEATGGEYREL